MLPCMGAWSHGPTEIMTFDTAKYLQKKNTNTFIIKEVCRINRKFGTI